MAVFGPTRLAMVLGNLIHLGVLLVAINYMTRQFGGRWGPLLICLCPGIFGTLVRFEPNLAAIAWTSAGLAALVSSQGLHRQKSVWLYGACFGMGLMMDRLSVAFFLLPALLPLLISITRRGFLNLIQAGFITLAIAGAYYREFFIRHSGEILSQATTGEIDSTGAFTEAPALIEWAYYPLTLLDSQAGPILGIVLLLGLFGRQSLNRSILLSAIGGGVVFFSVISKNQVFYTLPILGPLCVLASARPNMAILGILGGLWSFTSVGLGVTPGGPWMPEQWVSPRHTLARPPQPLEVDIQPALSALSSSENAPKHIAVLSEDRQLFEGFLLLLVRERWPETPARGVVMDPHGTFEMFHEMDSFLWIGPQGQDWPSATQIETLMRANHTDPSTMPPAPRIVEAQKESFDEIGRWPTGEYREMVVFRRR